MEYKHISDCWEAIRKAKTIDEVEELFEEFPNWAGIWTVQIENNSFDKKVYVVYNTYSQYGDIQEDAEELEIEVEEEEEEED